MHLYTFDGTCANCGCSLKNGYYTPKWADGDNSEGYITCPYCGCDNYDPNDDDDD